MPQCRITVEYDGAGYHGWQVQENARSVQAELERALNQLTGEQVRVRGASRTDAGVHARGQTAAFPMLTSIPLGSIPAALNSRLPDDIAVVAARLEDAAFNPRRGCVRKQYSYSITVGQVRPALADGRSWHVKRRLDIEAMREAAAKFAGDHDFTSFANREQAGGDNIRTIERSELSLLEPDPAGRPRCVYYVEGRSFLYNMVRSIVGTLVGVGSGRFSVRDIEGMFAKRDRAAAGQSAPPWGLCLEWVLYPGDARPPDRGGLF
ncbi:MAG: tRNA pseudouridine(38-40) synthase TruA [Planctomycetes bacterium]|nr:tRNA pseudouridine(38-40) synthase TruA [Planctomycetota bacterium]